MMGAQVEVTMTVKTAMVLCQAQQCKHNVDGLCSLSIISIEGGYSPDCQMYVKCQAKEGAETED